MAKTSRKTVRTAMSEAEFQEALATYASSDAGICKINADLDVKITQMREKVEDELSELTSKREEAFDLIKDYAVANKESLFGKKKKSMDTSHGTIGFRTGTPKLKPLKGFTWASITELLKAFLPDYVRTAEEPAKDKLLADRENEEVANNLKKVGISVVQDEAFFVELKKETTDAKS